jgi:hypothetical protein
MKKLNSIFFLLFLLLITGGFAAIARNAYGVQLLGWSTVGFAFFCLIGLFLSLNKSEIDKPSVLEFNTLTLNLTNSSMRVFLYHFVYVELIFSSAGIVLILVYGWHTFNSYKTVRSNNAPLFMSMALFYTCIGIFTLSLVLNPISASIAEITGFIGFITFILAVLSTLRIKAISVKNGEISITKYLAIQPNRATLLLSLFLLFSLYTGANMFNIVPDIQSSTMPQGYYELVREAENGMDKAADGKYRYQVYREHMEKFMQNQGLNK